MFGLLLLLASAAPDAPILDQATIDNMDKSAQEDPKGYIEVLLNCAVYHGIVAIEKGEDSKEEDDMAIMLITAANLVPPNDMDAVSEAYTDKLMNFQQELSDDKDGSVHKDLAGLGTVCLGVEEYAKATLLKAQTAAEAEPPN